MYKGYLGRAAAFTVGGIVLALNTVTTQAVITKLVGADTAIPNGQPGDTFVFLGDVVLDGDTFAFKGANTVSDLPAGVYRGSLSSGVLSVVHDFNTNSPASGFPLDNSFAIDLSGDDVASFGFSHIPNEPTSFGIFSQLTANGSLNTVADKNSSIRPSPRFGIDNGAVVYEGSSSTDDTLSGIYSTPASGGSTTTIVDTNTAVPGQPGKMFTEVSFKAGGFNDGVVAFKGIYDGGEGIYTVIPGQAPIKIVDSQTAFPTTNHGNQQSTETGVFNDPSIDNEELVFSVDFSHADPFEGDGLYLYSNNTVTLIADSDTPIPNDPANTMDSLGGIVYPANAAHYIIDSGRIVFNSFDGIFQYEHGNLTTIVSPADIIEGDSLFQWGISHTSLSGDNLIFYGYSIAPDFQSGSFGVYLTTIPEPGILTMSIIGLSVGVLKRRPARA